MNWIVEVVKILRHRLKDICAYCGNVDIVIPHTSFDPSKARCFKCLRSERDTL